MLSSGQDFGKKFLDSKHVLKVYLMPSRKYFFISFLPLCSVLVRLKILHLICKYGTIQDLVYRIFLDFSQLIPSQTLVCICIERVDTYLGGTFSHLYGSTFWFVPLLPHVRFHFLSWNCLYLFSHMYSSIQICISLFWPLLGSENTVQCQG